ncbi:hypothetical protein [Streptomyces flaveus]|uniref:Uncharacterized protein n=1 Tax=Streptomyces flaveus TaxID=66370 RepID=A0A917RP04_9ACTN|nr:hypothetical protein [Streptomyces flaveus]GGL16101.1 hypothetical protein GCM10010094_91240 [Streptomyces flaveus]
MINSAVRGVVISALTTALALFPAMAAHAEGKDKGNDIEKVTLTGVNVLDTMPDYVEAGDSWVTHLKLYSVKKKQLRYAGDAESECSAVKASADELTAQCTRVLRLKKGKLTLSDMITYKPDKPVTAKTGIIGGTGHYRSAYGDGYITLEGNRVHLTLNIDE